AYGATEFNPRAFRIRVWLVGGAIPQVQNSGLGYMAPLGKFIRFIPISRRLLQIIWPFLVIVVILVMLASESINIIMATRAYSEGESLWSKGQKQAIFYLLRYSETQSEFDFHK